MGWTEFTKEEIPGAASASIKLYTTSLPYEDFILEKLYLIKFKVNDLDDE
jgi:hypothetical protein